MYFRGKGEADEKNNGNIFFVDDRNVHNSRILVRGWR